MVVKMKQVRIINDFIIPKHDIDYGKDNDVEMLNHEIKDAFDKITSSLFSLDGGGWIIVSHCITQLKGAILLSVVVQRP